jgi:hypothetical protein
MPLLASSVSSENRVSLPLMLSKVWRVPMAKVTMSTRTSCLKDGSEQLCSPSQEFTPYAPACLKQRSTRGSEDRYIELRIGYRNHPSYVARLEGRCSQYVFKRDFNPFFKRREVLPDGSRRRFTYCRTRVSRMRLKRFRAASERLGMRPRWKATQTFTASLAWGL